MTPHRDTESSDTLFHACEEPRRQDASGEKSKTKKAATCNAPSVHIEHLTEVDEHVDSWTPQRDLPSTDIVKNSNSEIGHTVLPLRQGNNMGKHRNPTFV